MKRKIGLGVAMGSILAGLIYLYIRRAKKMKKQRVPDAVHSQRIAEAKSRVAALSEPMK